MTFPKGDEPRPKDRVQVSFAADWVGEQDGQRVVDVADGLGPIHIQIPAWASVEVLERADDPSKALRGEVREIDGMTAVCYGKDFWVYFSPLHHGARGGYGVYKDEQMVGSEVIGVVPGTPAAEANPVPPAIVERVRELLDNGQFERAVQVVRGAVADMSLSAGRSFVEGLRERDAAVPSVRVPNEPHGIPDRVRKAVAAHLVDNRMGDAIRELLPFFGDDGARALAYIGAMSEYGTYLEQHGGKGFQPRYFQLKNSPAFRWRTTEDGRIEHTTGGSSWFTSNYSTVEQLLAEETAEEVFPS